MSVANAIREKEFETVYVGEDNDKLVRGYDDLHDRQVVDETIGLVTQEI